MPRAALILFAVPMLMLLSGCTRAPVPTPSRESFVRVQGGTFAMPAAGECRALALIFVGTECPIANGYAPEIKRLHEEYAPRGVTLCVVYADPDLELEEAAHHAAEYGFPCPALLDPQLTLARRVGATVVPEAAVLVGKDVVYRGRIDDLYPAFGKRRPEPTQRELRAALDAVLAGRPVATPRVPAIGCDIPFKQ